MRIRYQDLYNYAQNIEPSIDAENWLQFENLLTEFETRPGQMLFKKDMNVSSCYIVMDGIFKVYFLNKNYREFIRNFHQKYEIIAPFTELLSNLPSKIFAESLDNGRLLAFEWVKFQEMSNSNIIWSRIAFKVLSLYFIEKEDREFELLTMKALERYQKLVKINPHVIELVPQHQIANYLGTTPVALTRLIRTGRTSPKKYKHSTKV